MRTGRATIFLIVDGKVAVIKRWRPDVGHYALLPGGGVEGDETVEAAAVREGMEELGLELRVVEVLEVEQREVPHTYLRCAAIGGEFGTGTGEEYDGSRPPERGTYTPALVDVEELATIGIKPEWLVEAVPRWLS